MDTEEPFNNIEKECAEFVAGYVANRFFNKYPNLIAHSDKDKPICWTDYISRGQLKIPSDNLMRAVKQLEIHFRSLHGDNLSKSTNIFKTLTDKLQISTQDLKLPLDVLQCLVRTRTYIRLNNLNNQIMSQKFKKFETFKKQKFTK